MDRVGCMLLVAEGGAVLVRVRVRVRVGVVGWV